MFDYTVFIYHTAAAVALCTYRVAPKK